jgi:catechol 2,3-dioxygenase-like lactoylglutathione lyase family enzyme
MTDSALSKPTSRSDEAATTVGRPFDVARIDHVVLRCRDVNAMVDFYCGVLGLEVAKRNARLGLIHLRAGNAMIDLIPSGDVPTGADAATAALARGNMDHFCLRVEPFDVARLRAYFDTHGIGLGELRVRFGAEGDGESFYIHDPEGNRVELKGPSRAPGS